jgi:hypothetical protein
MVFKLMCRYQPVKIKIEDKREHFKNLILVGQEEIPVISHQINQIILGEEMQED